MKHIEMMNQSLKGMAGALGAGSGFSHIVRGVETPQIESKEDLYPVSLLEEASSLEPGGVVVIASKVVSIVEGRRIYDKHLTALIRRRSPSKEIYEYLQDLNVIVSQRDLICLDMGSGKDEWVLGPLNPNQTAYEIAKELCRLSGIICDVVISDSGAGYDKGVGLIGIPTYIATPIGATAGCGLLHSQRAAAAAEMIRNQTPRTPFVLIHPESWRSGNRDQVGEFRYRGYIDAKREVDYLPDIREKIL